jgi:hypothetical protein
MKRFLALGFLLSACVAAAATMPSEISAQYRVTSAGVTVGRVSELFMRKGDTYKIHSTTRSEGPLKVFLDDSVTLQSAGKVVSTGLQPHEFGQHRAKDSSRDIKATFDWDNGVMHSQFKGESSHVTLPRETQDRLSVMYQFMNLKQHGDRVVMPMSNGRKVEYYTYRLVDNVRIETPAGQFDTVHYQRVVENPKETRADVWLAKDHFNFPVRVVFDDPKGFKLEQTLEALQHR